VAAFVLNGTPRPAISGDDHEVVADPIRLRQILRNLFTNALRFGGPNIGFESVRVGDKVMLRVTDDGPGPDPELVESIFEPYVHVRWERTPASIGLGLAVSRHLAQLMGGDLTYGRRSEVTVFELVLPAAD
jgi:signal transduction histidine kinase